ncbi:MAG: DNA repair and recombination protein RadB [Candidatus Aenigmarchaeota archaeon]|nr:DNA repair and recombination protein RadB [Candidatus Aenigmarchaeota archaeon]
MGGRQVFFPDPFPTFMREIEAGAVTNLFGEPGAGKTNLCLLAMLHCVESGGTVTYIDTEGGFSFDRLEQLKPDYRGLLPRINLLEPKDFREQGTILRELKKTDLVVVDSLSSLYRLEFSGDAKPSPDNHHRFASNGVLEANRELSKQLSVLSLFARQHKVPVLVTNHTFRHWDTGNPEMVGGDAVRYWSKTVILLEKTGRQGERKATIIKHRSLPEGGSVKFVITQDGIKPGGFKLF